MANAAEQPNVIRRIFHLLDRAPGLIPSSDPAAQARLCIEIAEREESLAELCLTELRHGSSVEPEPVEDMFNELVATALRTRLLTTGDTESVAEIIEHAASDLWPDGFPLELQQMYYPVAATHLRQALLDTADKGGTESPFWGVVESLGGMRAVLDRERVWQTLAAEGETQSRIIALHFYAWRDAETIAELLSLELAAVERYLRDADLLLEALRDDEETDSVE